MGLIEIIPPKDKIKRFDTLTPMTTFKKRRGVIGTAQFLKGYYYLPLLTLLKLSNHIETLSPLSPLKTNTKKLGRRYYKICTCIHYKI